MLSLDFGLLQYRPFYYQSGKKDAGIDIDILNTLSQQLNFRYEDFTINIL